MPVGTLCDGPTLYSVAYRDSHITLAHAQSRQGWIDRDIAPTTLHRGFRFDNIWTALLRLAEVRASNKGFSVRFEPRDRHWGETHFAVGAAVQKVGVPACVDYQAMERSCHLDSSLA